ncbi:uncharacterized protein LOC115095464 isoform X2 [Rhinatrema bivittatum]|uniref:uncharacterized protein LOC115095464 isoform X2 n=1 Tax=Rhinatrema bivittatum TaxID=194408 RepID=UPI00112BB37E|nr:uncharacterized protein LOC115095464 isoform X2 [Rhinatrema bivittatum]
MAVALKELYQRCKDRRLNRLALPHSINCTNSLAHLNVPSSHQITPPSIPLSANATSCRIYPVYFIFNDAFHLFSRHSLKFPTFASCTWPTHSALSLSSAQAIANLSSPADIPRAIKSTPPVSVDNHGADTSSTVSHAATSSPFEPTDNCCIDFSPAAIPQTIKYIPRKATSNCCVDFSPLVITQEATFADPELAGNCRNCPTTADSPSPMHVRRPFRVLRSMKILPRRRAARHRKTGQEKNNHRKRSSFWNIICSCVTRKEDN